MMQLRLTPAVKVLLIACFALFVIQNVSDQFLGGNLLGILALVPSAFVLDFHFWQLFTYVFLHGDVMHLVFNLLMIVFVGAELETLWGARRFLIYFFFCSSVAGLGYLLMQFVGGGAGGLRTPMVGASGGIYGLLLAYGILFGERVLLLMMIFPMKAKHFVWVLAGIEFMTSLFSSRAGGGLSSIAHLGGMAGGLFYLWFRAFWLRTNRGGGGSDRGRTARSARVKKKSHLKLVTRDADPEFPEDGPKTWH